MSPKPCAAAIVIAVGVVVCAATTGAPALAAPEAIPDEILLKFNADVPVWQRDAVLAEMGALRADPLGRTGAVRVRLPGASAGETVARFAGHPLLAYVEPNFVYRAAAIPDDPWFPQQWALRNTGQTGGTPGADIRATEAWDLATGSPDVVIGILDSGMDLTHPDLAPNLFTNPGEIPGNAVDDDGNGYVDDVHGWDFVSEDNDPQDDNGHGTSMAGIAGALGDNGIGVAGVGWHARLLPLKFLDATGSGTTADAIRALDYAAALDVPVTNNSWGGGPFSQALLDAIVAAEEAGVLFVTSAGGSGLNLDDHPTYPASYDVPSVIAVAATDDDDTLYAASGYGPKTVALAAPGVGILTTWPGASYRQLSGSSMATAFVAGALALVLGHYPGLPAIAAAAHLLDRVEKLPSLIGLVRTEGRLDAYRPLAEEPATAVEDGPGPAGAEAPARLWWVTADGGAARLEMYLPRAGSARLEILDVRGRRVRPLFSGTFPAGRRSAAWDGRDGDGGRLARGIYLARLTGAWGAAVARLVLLR